MQILPNARADPDPCFSARISRQGLLSHSAAIRFISKSTYLSSLSLYLEVHI